MKTKKNMIFRFSSLCKAPFGSLGAISKKTHLILFNNTYLYVGVGFTPTQTTQNFYFVFCLFSAWVGVNPTPTKKTIASVFRTFGVVLLWILVASCLGACTAVKPYQRQYINDSEMQMSSDAGKQYTQYVHSIRQGATPAGTPKSSGGCGCN